ncbi:MAG TPA: hypothetical protein VD738_12235 [Nitrospira sp.]|nr:hypothetical protein [Nitrospira sp.]
MFTTNLQLIFEDEAFSIYDVAEVKAEGTSVQQGQRGFCDTVVGLIGQRVTAVSASDAYVLRLAFDGGAKFAVLAGEAGARGPKAFEFSGKGQPSVVEQNA